MKKQLWVQPLRSGRPLPDGQWRGTGYQPPVHATHTQVCCMRIMAANELGIHQSDQTVVFLMLNPPNGFTAPEQKAARQKIMSLL